MPPDNWDWKYWLTQRPSKPGQIIGTDDDPYLYRWYVIPRNQYLNLYLHKFLRSDDDRALHDHPWWFLSFMLKGGYWEHREGSMAWRSAPSIAFRKADTMHRVELDYDDKTSKEKPCWTFIVTGPKVREWGFKCPQGWRHWKEFVYKNGCGE